jgi:hypothetical protein
MSDAGALWAGSQTSVPGGRAPQGGGGRLIP